MGLTLAFSTALRNALAAKNAVPVDGGFTSANLAFVDNGASPDSITDSDDGFIAAGIIPGDYLVVANATTAGNDGIWGPVLTVAAGTVTVATTRTAAAEAGHATDTKIYIIKGNDFRGIFRYGVIEIRAGNAPSTGPDAVETGTLLALLTQSAGDFVAGIGTNGLVFDDIDMSNDGVVGIPSGDSWQGLGLADGVAGYFILYDNAYDDGADVAGSEDKIRAHGSCGVSGTIMTMPTTTIVTGKTVTIDSFDITLPAS